GVGFSVVRWIKTAENATDYSVMNTARQLLWLNTSREEKYKAKQAIDTFFVRGGDVLSAGVVALGAGLLHLTVPQFAMVNVALTIGWIGIAIALGQPRRIVARQPWRPLVMRAATAAVVLAIAAPAFAQQTRAAQIGAEQAEKATTLHPYEPDRLEERLESIDAALLSKRPVRHACGVVSEELQGGGRDADAAVVRVRPRDRHRPRELARRAERGVLRHRQRFAQERPHGILIHGQHGRPVVARQGRRTLRSRWGRGRDADRSGRH